MADTQAINWGMVRAAVRRRIVQHVGIGIGRSDVDDATQDAVLRVAALIGKGKPVGWAVVVGTKRQLRYCRGGYRPAPSPVEHAKWEYVEDADRLYGKGLERDELRERGLLSAQELRLEARIG